MKRARGTQRAMSSPRPEDTFEIVTTRDGVQVVRDLANGELMHPVGPALEARAVYAEPARIDVRLQQGPVIVYDVGLGAGSNALEAWRRSEARAPDEAQHKLTIYSFDRTADAMRLALMPEHATEFGFSEAEVEVAQAVLRDGVFETQKSKWVTMLGELPGTLTQPDELADVVFWDMYSTKVSPEMWTLRCFETLRAQCSDTATLHTYAAATSFRSGLMLAGFWVGFGPATGTKAQTTQAAVRKSDLPEPLDARWYQRLLRSSAPLPVDAPAGAMDSIAPFFEQAE